MTFWDNFGSEIAVSQIDQILQKDAFQLEELLDIDDVLQECSSHNQSLVKYLCRADILKKLISYVTGPVPPSDQNLHLRYPYFGSQLICCNQDILSSFDEASYLQLFSIVSFHNDDTHQMDILHANHFTTVALRLLEHQPLKMIEFLKENIKLMEGLLNHLYNFSVSEFVCKLIQKGTEPELKDPILQLFSRADIMTKVVSNFISSSDVEVHSNVATVIRKLIESYDEESTVVAPLLTSSLFSELLSSFSKSSTHIEHGMAIMITLLKQSEGKKSHISIIELLIEKLPMLADLLKEQPLYPTWPTPCAILGCCRLRVIEFFVALIETQLPILEERVIELNVTSIAMKLFLEHSQNNILHGLISQMVSSIFSQSAQRLHHQIIVNESLLDTIIDQCKSENRQPNRGYLMLIAHDLNQRSKAAPQLLSLIESNPSYHKWNEFVEKEVVAFIESRDKLGAAPIRIGAVSSLNFIDNIKETEDDFEDQPKTSSKTIATSFSAPVAPSELSNSVFTDLRDPSESNGYDDDYSLPSYSREIGIEDDDDDDDFFSTRVVSSIVGSTSAQEYIPPKPTQDSFEASFSADFSFSEADQTAEFNSGFEDQPSISTDNLEAIPSASTMPLPTANPPVSPPLTSPPASPSTSPVIVGARTPPTGYSPSPPPPQIQSPKSSPPLPRTQISKSSPASPQTQNFHSSTPPQYTQNDSPPQSTRQAAPQKQFSTVPAYMSPVSPSTTKATTKPLSPAVQSLINRAMLTNITDFTLEANKSAPNSPLLSPANPRIVPSYQTPSHPPAYVVAPNYRNSPPSPSQSLYYNGQPPSTSFF